MKRRSFLKTVCVALASIGLVKSKPVEADVEDIESDDSEEDEGWTRVWMGDESFFVDISNNMQRITRKGAGRNHWTWTPGKGKIEIRASNGLG